MESNSMIKKIELPNGETLAYCEFGDSSTVLILIHGACISSYYFSPFLPSLSESLRVIALDLRGHGQSSYNKPLKDHDDNVEDLKMLVDALNIKKCFLLGLSTGGGVVMKFAAKYPEYVEGLILQSSIGTQNHPLIKVGQDGKPTNERVSTEEEALNHPFVVYVQSIISQKDKEKVKTFIRDSLCTGRKKFVEENVDDSVNDWFTCRCFDRSQYANNIFNITSKDNAAAKGTNEIAQIKCKVMIQHGAKDVIIPVKVAEETKELFGELADLKIFSEGGHSVMEDYPEEITDLIKRFCSNSIKISLYYILARLY